MARVTATKNNRLNKKPELAVDDAIRKLVKASMEMNFNSKDFKHLVGLSNQEKGHILQTVIDAFGEAIFVTVDSAVANELSLIGDDGDDADNQANDY